MGNIAPPPPTERWSNGQFHHPYPGAQPSEAVGHQARPGHGTKDQARHRPRTIQEPDRHRPGASHRARNRPRDLAPGQDRPRDQALVPAPAKNHAGTALAPVTGPGTGQAPGTGPSTGPGTGQSPGQAPAWHKARGQAPGQAPATGPSTGPGTGKGTKHWARHRPRDQALGPAPAWHKARDQAPGQAPATGPSTGQGPVSRAPARAMHRAARAPAQANLTARFQVHNLPSTSNRWRLRNLAPSTRPGSNPAGTRPDTSLLGTGPGQAPAPAPRVPANMGATQRSWCHNSMYEIIPSLRTLCSIPRYQSNQTLMDI